MAPNCEIKAPSNHHSLFTSPQYVARVLNRYSGVQFSCGHQLQSAGSLCWVAKVTFLLLSESRPFGGQNVDFHQVETTSASLHHPNT